MPPFHDVEAVKGFVARAVGDGPRGTQNRLARHVGVPAATVNRWANRVQCPSLEHWPAIETFFGWEPGTLIGVAGLGPVPAADIEAAILAAVDLTEDARDILLRVYRSLRSNPAGPMDGRGGR